MYIYASLLPRFPSLAEGVDEQRLRIFLIVPDRMVGTLAHANPTGNCLYTNFRWK